MKTQAMQLCVQRLCVRRLRNFVRVYGIWEHYGVTSNLILGKNANVITQPRSLVYGLEARASIISEGVA